MPIFALAEGLKLLKASIAVVTQLLVLLVLVMAKRALVLLVYVF